MRLSSKSLSGAREKLGNCKLTVIQGDNRGTHATLTNTTLTSIANGAKGHPEIHLGDNKGTSKGHLGDTNHTDTLITQSTRSTKHTHNKSIIPRIPPIRQSLPKWPFLGNPSLCC